MANLILYTCYSKKADSYFCNSC